MTNRVLIYLVRNRKPLMLGGDEPVRYACQLMWERRTGSVLVVDKDDRLTGIFTGRDAMRLLGKGGDGATPVAEAMTRDPVSFSSQDRAVDALRAMCDGGFRHVPVVENGKIAGIVSRGDFKGMEFEEYCWRHLGNRSGSAGNRTLGEMVAGQTPLVLSANDTVGEACRQMWERKAGSVLVVDGRRRLAGIFTGRDAVRSLAKVKDAAASRVGKAMTRDPATLPPDCHAIDALRAMNDGGFRHVPVLDDGKIVGIVSRNDFTGVELDRLDEEEHLKECIW